MDDLPQAFDESEDVQSVDDAVKRMLSGRVLFPLTTATQCGEATNAHYSLLLLDSTSMFITDFFA